MKLRIRILHLIYSSFFICLFHTAIAQPSNIGTPPISNFTKNTYGAGTQNWDIDQGKNGIMYFANNGGLMSFDGNYWDIYGVRNQTIVRSVKVVDDQTVFVGAQGEFGFFTFTNREIYAYQSLSQKLPEKWKTFGDVWHIERLGDTTFFCTKELVFEYHKTEFNKAHRFSDIRALQKVGQTIWLSDDKKGLMKWENGAFKALEGISNTSLAISSVLPYNGDTLLLVSFSKGLFLYENGNTTPFQTNAEQIIRNSYIFCASMLPNHSFALGTSNNGIFIVSKTGKVTHHLNRSSGLQQNNILSLFVDKVGNLWTGLGNGIDLVEMSSPFSYITDENIQSTGYSTLIHNDVLYFGTSNGVYASQWKSYYNPIQTPTFELIPNTQGQVWHLEVFDDDVFLNHNDGVFILKNNTAYSVASKPGGWMQLPLNGSKTRLLSGFYEGLGIIEKNNNWQLSQDFVQDFKESCRVMAQDQWGNIWVTHPYRGVFKVVFDENYTAIEEIQTYNASDGLPMDLDIYVFKIGDEAVFCTQRSVYSFNQQQNRFEPNEKWNKVFGESAWVKRLIEAPTGDIWFVVDDEVGILEVEDGGVYKKIKKRVFPQLSNKLMGGFEDVYHYNEHNVFIPYDNGFIHFNPKLKSNDTTFQVLIRSVNAFHQETLTKQTPEEGAKVGYQYNNLKFTFAATTFSHFHQPEYEYMLEGFDKKWSGWTTDAEKEYTNLNPGVYTFKVRSKNVNGWESEVVTYRFRIMPPWYASRLAFLVYILFLGGGLFSLIFFPRKRFEREKAVLQSEQEKTLLQKEQEHQLVEQRRQQQISKLEKEKLELQIQSKNQELASTTMHLVQKSEMLQKLKEELQKIAKNSSDTETTKDIRKVIRKVVADERLDQDWEHFAQYFDQVHSDFLQRLRSKYPQLSPKDHRLCAYLRMNLTSKEIAPLMNISVRGVEIARYRLRKKLDLDGDINLIELMMAV